MILLSSEFSKKYLIMDKIYRVKVETLINQIGREGDLIASEEGDRYFIFNDECRVYYKKMENDIILLDFKFREDIGQNSSAIEFEETRPTRSVADFMREKGVFMFDTPFV